MRIVWMFRAVEAVTGRRERGTLTVCYDESRMRWRAIFVPDGGPSGRFEIEQPSLDFYGAHGEVMALPERDNQESRELGQVKVIRMEEHVLFEPYSRLPATGAKAITTHVSLSAGPTVRGG